MTPSQVLEIEFELLRDDLVKRYDELGMRASGNFEKDSSIEVDGLTARLYAPHYIEQLVNGRESGKFPPISVIEQWIEDKGIKPIEDNISVSSLAFLIARKIAREGTRYFQEGGTDLVDSVVTPERIQKIIDKVSQFHISEFVLNVTNIFEELAA